MFKKKPEGSLVALVFDDPYKADEARATLLRLEGEGALDIEEMAVIVRKDGEKYRVSQDANTVSKDQKWGHRLGHLVGMVTGVGPLTLVGTLGGRVVGMFTDNEVTNRFTKEIGKELTAGTSALILFGRFPAERREQIVARLAEYHPKIVHSALPADVEAQIEAELEIAPAG